MAITWKNSFEDSGIHVHTYDDEDIHSCKKSVVFSRLSTSPNGRDYFCEQNIDHRLH